ncbi:MAG: hypothetical protein ACREL5_11600 [Gemmatimonadales bacterium]
MTALDDWVANGWLVRHQAAPGETRDLLAAARSDLADARKDVSPGWQFAIAYNAALRLCTVTLQAAGYRATRDQKHYRTIAALPLVIGDEAGELAHFIDHSRTRRHEVTYDAFSGVSPSEAKELIKAAGELDRLVRAWLRTRPTP